jgi:hypothetical protein
VLAVAVAASGQTNYNGATYNNYGDNSADIANVVVNNDSSNIYFTITMDPYANISTSGDYYADYEVGIQMNGGAGGQQAINATYGTGVPAAGNPYGSAVGISSGENYFIGSYLDGPSYSGGAQLYSYDSGTGWSQIGATAPITEVSSNDGSGSPPSGSISFEFPLASLGLSVGSSFNFDVWTSYSGGQGAYDALDQTGAMSTAEPTAPYSGGSYDSATATGSVFSSTVYTVVPEPASLALLGGAGLLMLRRRRA